MIKIESWVRKGSIKKSVRKRRYIRGEKDICAVWARKVGELKKRGNGGRIIVDEEGLYEKRASV